MKWLTICVVVVLSLPAVIPDPVKKEPFAADEVTTQEPKEACKGDTCDECLKNEQCYFCLPTKTCAPYPVKHIIPSYKNCTLGDVRWGVCWMNFKAMIISVSVLAGVLLISIIICCCCCCRKKKRSRLVQDDAKREREKEERRIKGLERQKERQSRNDEIRRKYGLIKDDHPYQKFDSQNS